jgi:hypothetical protein
MLTRSIVATLSFPMNIPNPSRVPSSPPVSGAVVTEEEEEEEEG